MSWGAFAVLGVVAVAVGFFAGIGWASRKMPTFTQEEEFESHQW